ncbi:Uncharacterized protein FKW44_001871 [Caligus rogercresseyi]|uniref:Uncharacterized protein n=1 Tax=Caligus rogercresseyi TaxID=217165 RepID=A0A7T8KJC2_CALRO|nr:Uncharacterized protein FKW44_023504 [Caligus rogercresseyi]QQP57017.1 Uncharacterized protein FKW44_001871 [Caligus rogercresseyi]
MSLFHYCRIHIFFSSDPPVICSQIGRKLPACSGTTYRQSSKRVPEEVSGSVENGCAWRKSQPLETSPDKPLWRFI